MIIAVIAPVEPAPFFDLLWQGVWEGTFDVAPFGVEVRNLTTDTDDVGLQEAILKSLLEEKAVHAIALAPAHASTLNLLIRKHVENGTPVVTFHSDAPESGRTLFVGPDALQGGALAGEALIKMMGGHGRIVSFPGSVEKFHLAQRYEGLHLELSRSQGRVEEIACFPPAGDEWLTTDMLLRLAPVNGIYVGTEEIAKIAGFLEESGISVPCVGFTLTDDVVPFVERRTVSAVIDDSRYRQGYFAIQKAYEAAMRKGRSAPVSVNIPNRVVFSSNVRDESSGQSLNEAFDALVLQRTETMRTYQKMLEEANAKLESLATTDALTGLFNRRKFDEMLDLEISQTRRQGHLSLLMIDLNWFKQVNDHYGHQAGDEALKAVAQVIATRCRTSDMGARLGGDEFAVLMPGTDRPGAEVVRSAITELVAAVRIQVGAEELRLSVSIGVATMSGKTASGHELIALADQDMYRTKSDSKAAGRRNADPHIRVGDGAEDPGAS